MIFPFFLPRRPSLFVAVCWAILYLTFSTPGFAASTETADDIAQRVHTFYQNIDSLSFQFTQRTEGQLSGRPKTGKGTGLFYRNNDTTLMRWNYITPDRQILTSDGTTLSMYFEKLNQMIIAPVNKSQADILFAFFAGKQELSKSFNILDMVEDKSEIKGLYLLPKDSSSQIDTVKLWVSAESLIRRVEIIDHFETRTIINISQISINPYEELDQDGVEELFSFTPPEGTEIINN